MPLSCPTKKIMPSNYQNVLQSQNGIGNDLCHNSGNTGHAGTSGATGRGGGGVLPNPVTLSTWPGPGQPPLLGTLSGINSSSSDSSVHGVLSVFSPIVQNSHIVASGMHCKLERESDNTTGSEILVHNVYSNDDCISVVSISSSDG